MSEEQRVPAGSPEGGEWTSLSEGELTGARIHAEGKVKRADEARDAAAEDDPNLPQLNKHYFAAVEELGKINQALDRLRATPERRRAMDEQTERNRQQREATARLAERDKRPASTPESRAATREASDNSHGAYG